MAEAFSPRLVLFEKALGRLEEALTRPEDPIVRDACIQRFEFTFEMAWKAIRDYALAEGLDCVSPRDCFRGLSSRTHRPGCGMDGDGRR